MTPAVDVPVLIVDGGPVGLTASIWLSRCGVPSLPAPDVLKAALRMVLGRDRSVSRPTRATVP